MEGTENIWEILPPEIVLKLTEYLSLQDVGRLTVSRVLIDAIVQNLVWKGICTRRPFSLKTMLKHVKFGRTWESTRRTTNLNSYENEPNADQFNYRLLLKEYFMIAILRTKLRTELAKSDFGASWAEISVLQEDSTSQPTAQTNPLLLSQLYYFVDCPAKEGVPKEFRGIRIAYKEDPPETGVILGLLDTVVNKFASVFGIFNK